MDKLLKHPFVILRFVLALCYIGLGGFIFFAPDIKVLENHTWQIVFAAVLFIYGVFRFYRTFIDFKNIPDA